MTSGTPVCQCPRAGIVRTKEKILKRVLCALALVVPVALQAQTVQIDTAAGPVDAPENPATVVALDFAAIDTLNALQVPLAGRPDFTPPAFLTEALTEVPSFGTLFEPDFEALAAMAPDLIVAGGRSQTQLPMLSKVAPTLDMTIDGSDLIRQTEDRIDAYGLLFAKTDQAAALKRQIDAALASTAAAVADKGDAMILLTNGGKISAYGANSRFGWIHNALNLPEAYPGLVAETHGEAVSFEFVAKADPDWILVIDRGAAVGQGGEAAAATLDNPLIAGTTAGKNGHIVYLDPAAMYLSSGGYQSLMLVLGQLTEAFAGQNS